MAGLATKSGFKSPRVSFFWISLAQIACTLPHFLHIPLWVSLLCGFCVFWRVMVYQGRWSFPHRYIRYALVILAMFGLMVTFPRMLSIQAAVTLLIITYYMKLLEMFRLKDVYIILILSYFVIASAFLFHETVPMLAYFLLAFLLTTIALVSSNRTEAKLGDGKSFRQGLILCLQAAPVGLCLFLFFPRFEPFWILDLKKEGPSVGISDTMSPADIAELGATEGVAFRAEFIGDVPPVQERYWRVLTLSNFDGEHWRSLFTNTTAEKYFESAAAQRQLRQGIVSEGVEYEYQLSLEPSQQQWLPVLDRALSVNTIALMMPDFSFMREKPVMNLIGYRGISAPAAKIDQTISPWLRRENLALPAGFNPKTIEYAQDTFQRLGGQNEIFIEHVMAQFRDQNFFYTLKPGFYGKNMVDEFFFERRKGFCAHYASTMAVMLRAVGIPSRVVIGYQGGTVNPIGGHLVVNQYDAHAWVEAWVSGEGWRRYDPTAMVAPWRILVGVEEMMRQTASSEVPSLQGSFMHSNPVVNKMRLFLDYTNHRWNKYVVNYDQATQRQVFEQLFGEWNLKRLVLVMAGSVGSILGFLALVLLWQSRRNPQAVEDRILWRCLKSIARRYDAKAPGETLSGFLTRLQTQMNASEHQDFAEVIRLYSKLAYENLSKPERQTTLRTLRIKVHQLNRQLQHIF